VGVGAEVHWKCAELRTPPPPYPAFGGRFQVLVAGLVARGGVALWLWGVGVRLPRRS